MKKVSKLRKIALMNPDMFENTLDQISDKGRAILQSIEEYKFSIDQTLRVVKNDQALTNIINQKKKNLDHAAQDLYTIVFEIENVDISEAYNNQEEATDPNKAEGDAPAEPQDDVPKAPSVPGGPPASNKAEEKPEDKEEDKKEEEKPEEEPKK